MNNYFRLRTKIVFAGFLIFLVGVTFVFLLNGNIGDNITYGRDESTRSQLPTGDIPNKNECGCVADINACGIQSTACFDNVQEGDYLGELCILMYHNVLKGDKKQSVYCINQNSLRKDFEYLKNNGYRVISFDELLDYVYGRNRLPQKAVMITFDDGYVNNVKYALPLLEEYGYTALFSVVGSYTLLDKTNPKVGGDFVYLGWQEIYELSKNKYAEIALHSYDLHALKPRLGCAKLANESDEEYKKLIKSDTQRLIDKLYDVGLSGNFAKIYTYPYGKYTKLSQEVLTDMGVEITLTCNEGTNHIYNINSLKLLKRINRDATKSSLEYFFDKYDY